MSEPIHPVPSGLARSLEIVFLGTVLVILGVAGYPIIAALNLASGVGSELLLMSYAYLTLGLIGVGSCVSFYGATRALASWSTDETSRKSLHIPSTVATVLAKGRYPRLLLASSLAYGVFYAFASGIIVYQPAWNFSEVYHVAIPSVAVATCCGSVGETPQAVVYLTHHVGFLLVPINVLLLFSLSWLVGLNASFALLVLRFRAKNLGLGWLGGIGAFIGLFTSCPTCAGLAIIALFGGTSTLSASFFLGPLQTVFVMVSIPILVITPLVSARSLRRLQGQACAVS